MTCELRRLRATFSMRDMFFALLDQMPEFHGDDPVNEAEQWFAGHGYELSNGAFRHVVNRVREELSDEQRQKLEGRERQETEEFEPAPLGDCPPLRSAARSHASTLLGDSRVQNAYFGSHAATTRRLLKDLAAKGVEGQVAAQLFRAQKASARAKQYRGGTFDGRGTSYRRLAYDRKGECLCELSLLLLDEEHGLQWGWGRDGANGLAPHVMYIDLPNGQVSFHSAHRFAGPDYSGEWDRAYASEERILEFCERVFASAAR